MIAALAVACGNSRNADFPEARQPQRDTERSSAASTTSAAAGDKVAADRSTRDADADRALERARAALSGLWEEWCWQRARPAIEEIWNNYAPLNLEKLEQDLLMSLRTLDEIGCGRTSVAARTWMYVGLVRAGSNTDRQGTARAFREALRIDPAAQLDEPLADEQTRSMWSRLQQELGSRKRPRVHVPGNEHGGLLLALRKAGLCSSCSVARRARAWILLGTWQALRGETGAADSFREALSLDQAAELDDRVRPRAAVEAMQTARTPSSQK